MGWNLVLRPYGRQRRGRAETGHLSAGWAGPRRAAVWTWRLTIPRFAPFARAAPASRLNAVVVAEIALLDMLTSNLQDRID